MRGTRDSSIIGRRFVLNMITLAIMGFVVACGSEDESVGSKDSVGDQSAADTSGSADAADTNDSADAADTNDSADAADTNDSADAPAEASGDTGAGGSGVYVAPDGATTFEYRLHANDGSDPLDLPATFAGTEDINGHTYRRFEIGDHSAAEVTGLVIWSNYAEDAMETGGAQVFYHSSPDEPSLAYTFDEPLKGSFLLDEGSSASIDATGTFNLFGDDTPFEIALEYTLVGVDETVEVPAGTFDGCIHYRFVENSTDLTGYETDYWVKSGVGIIKATTVPGFGAIELLSYTLP